MSDFYIMEAVQLFAGDDDPSPSAGLHLEIEELKLPDLQKEYQEHKPGGSMLSIEVLTGIQKLEPTFKLKGENPRMLAQFGMNGGKPRTYTALGAIRSKRTGSLIQSKAIIHAELGKVGPDAFKRGDLRGHDYTLNAVTHYELWYDGDELFYFDFFESAWRSGGVDQMADVNRMLGIS